MMTLILVSILATLAVVAPAQNTAPTCPTIDIIGPSRVAVPGDPLTFAVTLSSTPANVKYVWKVSRGVIEAGQGTQSIVVRSSRADAGQDIQASVSLSGLQTSCSAMAIGTVAPMLERESVDEWGKLPNDDQRGRLDNFFMELSNNPHHNGLFIIRTEFKEGKLAKTRWVRFILNHAKMRKFDKSRLVFALATVDYRQITLYRYLPGEEREICEKCKLIYGRDLKW